MPELLLLDLLLRAKLWRERQIFNSRVLRKEVEGLEYEPEGLAADKLTSLSVYPHLAAVCLLKIVKAAQKRGLTASRGADYRKHKNDIESVYTRFPRLAERKNQIAGTLSGGEQQMLAMGRALMSHPKLLMLDEPSMGLSPLLVDQVFEIIKDINKDGTTILLVEQNAGKSLAISDRAYVLENGNIVLSGTGAELMASDTVKEAYLGG